MFKFLGSLAVVLGLVAPLSATHCNQRIVERVVVNDYVPHVEAVVLVPHQNLAVREFVYADINYRPAVQVVEKIVQRERIVNRPARVVEKVIETPVRVVERVVNRPVRVRQRVVKKNVVVEQQVVVEKVIKNRNVQRIRGY